MRNILIIGIAVLIAGCDLSYFYSGKVGKAIRKELRELNKQKMVLSEITPFEWDELFLFEPYASNFTVCKKLDIPFDQCEKEIPEKSMDDGEMYIVFRNNNNIVHKEMYIRFNGDFTPLNFTQPLTPSTAIFLVKEYGKSASGKPWLKLIMNSNDR
ncbi:MAG: hypothetical protein GXP17_10920 [Gammaproteobacteria bacterium]|nr:hypothetical protein [Gammaproteobacteria bacterium]